MSICVFIIQNRMQDFIGQLEFMSGIASRRLVFGQMGEEHVNNCTIKDFFLLKY